MMNLENIGVTEISHADAADVTGGELNPITRFVAVAIGEIADTFYPAWKLTTHETM